MNKECFFLFLAMIDAPTQGRSESGSASGPQDDAMPAASIRVGHRPRARR